MTQKLHHSEQPVFMNSPAQTAMYIQQTLQNKVTNILMSKCFVTLINYMAHVKQMVHIRPQRSRRYHHGICPAMVPR